MTYDSKNSQKKDIAQNKKRGFLLLKKCRCAKPKNIMYMRCRPAVALPVIPIEIDSYFSSSCAEVALEGFSSDE